MDSSLIVSVIVAIVAIIPGVWALVNQATKDKAQVKLDMNAAAQNAAMNIIAPLQAEVTRLQNRIIELEKALIDKTEEIGQLMQAGIDKDSQIRILKYNMEGMQLRLKTFETKQKGGGKAKKEDDVTEIDVIDQELEEKLKENEIKKQLIKSNTLKTIETISNGSIVNTETTDLSQTEEYKL